MTAFARIALYAAGYLLGAAIVVFAGWAGWTAAGIAAAIGVAVVVLATLERRPAEVAADRAGRAPDTAARDFSVRRRDRREIEADAAAAREEAELDDDEVL